MKTIYIVRTTSADGFVKYGNKSLWDATYASFLTEQDAYDYRVKFMSENPGKYAQMYKLAQQ